MIFYSHFGLGSYNNLTTIHVSSIHRPSHNLLPSNVFTVHAGQKNIHAGELLIHTRDKISNPDQLVFRQGGTMK